MKAKKTAAKKAPAKAAAVAVPGSIVWIATASPQREGTRRAERAAKYWGAATVAEFTAAGGKARDLRRHAAKGLLQVAV